MRLCHSATATMFHATAAVISHMSGTHHRNLIQYNVASHNGLCNRLSICLVTIQFDLSPKSHYAGAAIMTCGDIVEVGLIKRFADVGRNIA